MSLGRLSVLGRCRLVCNPRAVAIGDYVTLGNDWAIADLAPGRGSSPKLHIGEWCIIMQEFQCNVAVSVDIGHHVLIAGRVFITDSDHVVHPSRPTAGNTDLVCKPVVIEHDCWIGQNAVVLKGVTIGHHSIVGANAVVSKDVPPCSIVGGIPARVIGTTDKSIPKLSWNILELEPVRDGILNG